MIANGYRWVGGGAGLERWRQGGVGGVRGGWLLGQHLNTTLPSFLLAGRGAQFHPGRPFTFSIDVLPLAGLAGSCCLCVCCGWPPIGEPAEHESLAAVA